jgi:uncharacterized protein YggT (Ycf19 family)
MVRTAHLVEDEAHRIADLEEVKQKLRHGVQESIEQRVAIGTEVESRQVDAVAHELKRKALSEVGETERELERARGLARLKQFVDYAFYLAYGMIGLRIALELFGARDASGFMRFLRALTAPLLAPFRGLMPDPSVGSSQLMLSFIVALIVYGLLHLAVKGLLRVLVFRDTKL